jgi:hypothetical protein
MSLAATFSGTDAAQAVAFIAGQRQLLKPFRRVTVNLEQTRIIDINRAELHFPGVTYGHPLLETILREAGASFDPATLHHPPPNPQGFREFGCTARYPWAHDRIL